MDWVGSCVIVLGLVKNRRRTQESPLDEERGAPALRRDHLYIEENGVHGIVNYRPKGPGAPGQQISGRDLSGYRVPTQASVHSEPKLELLPPWATIQY
jgi:hypothetical protein